MEDLVMSKNYYKHLINELHSMSFNLLKLLIPIFITFVVGMLVTPPLTRMMYTHKMWKKNPRKSQPDERYKDGKIHPDAISKEFEKINNTEEEVKTPRIGGVVIWVSVLVSTVLILLVGFVFPTDITTKLNFVSRNQTLLPFLALVAGSLVGLVDDMLVIWAKPGIFIHGFPRKYMLGIIFTIGLVFALWFFFKLGASSVFVPLANIQWNIGVWFIPFFLLVVFGVFSSGVIDGVDGLAGGVMTSIFSAYALIAYFQGQFDIAVFCAVIIASLLVFLWFNVPPARFYLGETGMLGLTLSLTLVAFLTNQVLLLLVIGFPLVATSLSSFIQIVSKKIRGPAGKVFRVAPLHHHFEAIGWSRPKITMRYWIISVFFSVTGVIISLL